MSSRKSTAISMVVNMLGPWLGYEALIARHYTEVQALLAVSVVPLVWSLAVLIRQRRWDMMACISGVSMLLSLLACVACNDVRALQVRDSYITLLLGVLFTGSVLIGRPFLLVVALSQAPPDKKLLIEARARTPEGRRFFVTITLVWGVVTIAEFAVKLWMIYVFPIAVVLAVSPWVLNIIIFATFGWTFWYARRFHRNATPVGACAFETPE